MQARRDTYSTFKDAKVDENGLIIPSDTGTSSGADTLSTIYIYSSWGFSPVAISLHRAEYEGKNVI